MELMEAFWHDVVSYIPEQHRSNIWCFLYPDQKYPG